jgi:hypothetical protein
MRQRQQPSIKKVIIARPRTSQQSDAGLLTVSTLTIHFAK